MSPLCRHLRSPRFRPTLCENLTRHTNPDHGTSFRSETGSRHSTFNIPITTITHQSPRQGRKAFNSLSLPVLICCYCCEGRASLVTKIQHGGRSRTTTTTAHVVSLRPETEVTATGPEVIKLREGYPSILLLSMDHDTRPTIILIHVLTAMACTRLSCRPQSKAPQKYKLTQFFERPIASLTLKILNSIFISIKTFKVSTTTSG